MATFGRYGTYDRDVDGYELSLIKNGYGLSFGLAGDKAKNLELEHVGLITKGVGVRRTNEGKTVA